MDEALEQSFVPFSTQSWWLEFITAVQENQNALSYLPESSSVSPPKTLYWALNAAVEILDVSGKSNQCSNPIHILRNLLKKTNPDFFDSLWWEFQRSEEKRLFWITSLEEEAESSSSLNSLW